MNFEDTPNKRNQPSGDQTDQTTEHQRHNKSIYLKVEQLRHLFNRTPINNLC